MSKLKYLIYLIVPTALLAATLAFNDGFSQSSPAASKPAESAAPSLKTQASSGASLLDASKLGDPLPRNLFVELSKLINPAVVSISTATNARSLRGGSNFRDPMQEFLEEFMGGRGGLEGMNENSGPVLQGLGSGFIIRADGLIITNNHVIEGADIIKVQLDGNSNESYEAEVVGRDQRTDIALIKIDAKKSLPVATLGLSKEVQVGEWVAAFGNPYGHAHTMTKGIISAVGRDLGREINRFPFLQTDASINPGNSGGPLVNTQGYVIGVNAAIDARAQGIGFAIPIDDVKQIVEQLERDGRVQHGYIGVAIAPVSPEIAQSLNLESTDGVVVTQLQPGGPAQKAGLKPYDIITDFNGKKIQEQSDLTYAVSDCKVGSTAKLKILRIENNRTVKKTLLVVIAENTQGFKPIHESKKYFGQKAPFNLGFKVAEKTPEMERDLGLKPGLPSGSVVIEIERGSMASHSGLRVGDVILDVNKRPAHKPTEVVKLLHAGQNILRVARDYNVVLVPLVTE
jgi:serine protease Do